MHYASTIFTGLLFLSLANPPGLTGASDIPIVDPTNVASPTVIGRWEKVSLRLREVNVTRIRVGPDKTVWVGTSDGLLAVRDFETYRPKFANPDDATGIIVKDILPLSGGRALIGTINGSIWLATLEKVTKMLDLGDRSEHTFVQLRDGTVLISNSFGRLRDEQLKPLLPLGIKARVVPGASDFAAVSGNRIWLVGSSGSLETLNLRQGQRSVLGNLNLPAGAFIRSISVGKAGQLYIAADIGCGVVNTDAPEGTPLAAQELIPGRCGSIVEGRPGELWAGTADGVYLYNGVSWQRWSHREGLDFGPIGDIADDADGNLWVGANGVFRYFNYFREIPLSSASRARSIASDGAGGVLAGFADGSVTRVKPDGTQSQINVGPAMSGGSTSDGYYPGALITTDSQSHLWILNHNGLYLYERGRVQRMGDYPAADSSHQPIVSFAVWDARNIYCGQQWTAVIYKLVSNGWKAVHQVAQDPGGSSVPAMAFDSAGRLWVVGTSEIYEQSDSQWSKFGPFPRSKDVKKNLYGAIAIQTVPPEVFTFGPWGYPVRVTKGTAGWDAHSSQETQDASQPWIVSRIISHPTWGRLAATEQGLYRWQDGKWLPYDEIDSRLSWMLSDVAVGDSSSFWILSGSLWQVKFPSVQPSVLLETAPPDVASATDVTLKLGVKDVQGPSGLWKYHVTFDPPIYPYGGSESSQRSEYHLANLLDGKKYQYSVEVEDAFGNTSEMVRHAFTVHIPWRQNPKKVAWVVAAAVITALALLLALITRRGPTGFLLRLLGGRRWRITSTGVDMAIEVEQSATNRLAFRLRTPTRMTTVVPRISIDLPLDELVRLQQESSAIADAALVQVQKPEEFGVRVQTLGERIYLSLPEAIRFAYEQTGSSNLQLVLDDTLLDIFWELWCPSEQAAAAVLHAIGRQVSSGEFAYKTPEPARDFRAVILSPKPGTGGGSKFLGQAKREVACIRRRLRSWGSRVHILPSDATKQEILEALVDCHIFHYVGHAQFDSEHPERSHLPIYGDLITAEELNASFVKSPSKMFLAFINGCGSARENPWNRGKAVFGLASVFLKDSTFFVGAQWPVQDSFCWEFADEFYRSAFPTSGALWWRWLRGRDLSGLAIAEALRNARLSMSSRPDTINTWPAYVYYGDPSSRIEWS